MSKLTGSYPLAIILCRYKEYEGAIPAAPVDYFEKLFITSGAGGVADYWKDISGGQINLDGSQVFGWYYLPHTLDEEDEWIEKKKVTTPGFSFRLWRIMNALEVAAANGTDLTPFYGVVAIYEQGGETGGFGTGPQTIGVNGKTYNLALTVLDQWGWKSPTISAHEVGHGLGFEHSFRFLGQANPSHEMYGDSWDIMSALNVYTFAGPLGSSGPGLNAVFLYSRGWLKADEVWMPSKGAGTVTLAPLHPVTPGVVRTARISGISHLVPVSGAGDFGWPLYAAPGYYVVEYRSGAGWDAGFETPGNQHADDVVLIHWGSNEPGWRDRSVLLPNFDGKMGLRAGDSFVDGEAKLRIDVVQIDKDKSATIEVGPAPSLTLSKQIQIESSQIVAKDMYDWPGVPGFCPPKTFGVTSVQQEQVATVTTQAFGLQSPVVLAMRMGKKSLNDSSGKVTLEVNTKLPDIGAGSSDPYKTLKKNVELTYVRQGNAIHFRNRPEDGTFAVGLTMRAIDAFGVEAVASITIPFSGWVLNFEDDFVNHSTMCLLAAIANHLKWITKTIPVERGNEPSPIEGPVDPTGIAFSRQAVTRSIEHLRLAATGVYGPLFEELVEPKISVPWLELGWRPERVEYQIPGVGR